MTSEERREFVFHVINNVNRGVTSLMVAASAILEEWEKNLGEDRCDFDCDICSTRPKWQTVLPWSKVPPWE